MIGYYAHGHGSGHCNYASIFAKVFDSSLIVITDRKYAFDKNVTVVNLENENPDGSEYPRNAYPEPRALHYAPINLSKITERNRVILETILKNDISLLIIDVSVEIAMLARVSSVPYAYVRLQGVRNDMAHLNAFEGASFLLAYFPKEMESADTPVWIKNKTIYLGFLSKYSIGSEVSQYPPEYSPLCKPVLLHLNGFGGSSPVHFNDLCDNFDIYVVGPGRAAQNSRHIVHIGIVDDTRPYIEHADIIVAACGSNTTSEILSLGKNFVAVPEDRHFNEQQIMAQNLDRLGWAVDRSKYGSLAEAVSALQAIQNEKPLNTSLCALKNFYQYLKFFNFNAHAFLENTRSENLCLYNTETPTLRKYQPKQRIYEAT